jgi:hypothetical protein
MRQTVVWCVEPSFEQGSFDIPPKPGSTIPGLQQRPIRCADQDASRSACQCSVQPGSSQGWLLKQTRPGKHASGSLSAFVVRFKGSDWRSASTQVRGAGAAVRAAAAAA